MKRKSITWVTADYFVDCDFNYDVLKVILSEFDIYWIIMMPVKNSRICEKDLDHLSGLPGLTIEFFYSKIRQRDFRRIFFYYGIYKKALESSSDVIYLNCVPDPYFVPVSWLFNKSKTVISAHDGVVNGGFDFKIFSYLSFKLTFCFFKHVCMFSYSQADLFRKRFKKSKIYVNNLSLKSFGKCKSSRIDSKIKFLSFGVINYSKNIELLIEAACQLFEIGYKNFVVSLNGRCDNWEYYRSKIRYPEIFECEIRTIGNDEIPNIFCTSHYFVQPYRYMSQSGALKVAFNYNLPVIAANLPAFKEEIIEGTNGFLFEACNVEDLKNQMKSVIENHEYGYPSLIKKMRLYTDLKYSSTFIGSRYLSIFNEIFNETKK